MVLALSPWGSETVRGVAEGPQLPFDPFGKDLEQPERRQRQQLVLKQLLLWPCRKDKEQNKEERVEALVVIP